MPLKHRLQLAVATDLVVFAFVEGVLSILLIRRGHEPFTGVWALPGGFLKGGETLAACAARELYEETALCARHLDQISAFAEPGRDPRGDVISIAYCALVRAEDCEIAAGSDAAAAQWWAVNGLPELAFDHDEIALDARQRLRKGLYVDRRVYALLPDKFTSAQVQSLFEAISGGGLDKRNFQSWLRKSGQLKEVGELRRGAHRPAKLYELKPETGN